MIFIFKIVQEKQTLHLRNCPTAERLVLVLDGIELNEEGVGFGVPVVKCKDTAFFSQTAKTSLLNGDRTLQKEYVLDTLSKRRFYGVNISNRIDSLLHKMFNYIYTRQNHAKALANRLMELRVKAKVETVFVKIKPVGTVTCQYSFEPNQIRVNVDFSGLQLDKCTELVMLNEQGANFFSNYSDLNGLLLSERHIGPWSAV
jgi:hypothetical protein